MWQNELIFVSQAIIVISLGLVSAIRGIGWLTGWLGLLTVVMNVFVLKQIHLFNFEVTSGDVYMIGMLTCLNYAREIYGKKLVNDAIMGSWFINLGFLLLTYLHLALSPSFNDCTQVHFLSLFSPTLRLVLASLVTIALVQLIDLAFFVYLKKFFKNRAFGVRSAISMIVSQVIDTLLFSFLGLYGIASCLSDVIIFSLITKIAIIIISIPTMFVVRFLKQQYKVINN
ncbi:putative integral membrane family protein [Chlamydia ibidis]|uniref:Queuosine precursor transporter n=2 Tax=Chlamydia ibidis TaxID=1405396 RepID=S7KLI9_9CHLA|nr:queuosine precursor transporter [Chlamydia ibidis]EPP35280.1 putative integral membrane family protein [Chlamydia ibidis]EQM62579.1 conserved hypothetical integral membrane family protein [Chlamydia ibidis 10-1398/6]